ncbi:peroxiredoxin (osmotically-inducible protein C) [Escherichia coli]|uniref:Peroxiredoxin (Osmotically-inducible protein C) n=1 Tax=Escherichia coli TaxID=562 RepID=A0A447XXJ1_ECOLX|nr:peroxiredoxin (osmotically-inducible protein C) [Escherichia coli]
MQVLRLLKSHWKSEVAVPGIDASTFDGIIQKAKAGCPVSQVLKAEITLDYQLKS